MAKTKYEDKIFEDTLLKLLGKNIADIRESESLTQEKVAELLGFDATASISNIERGIQSIFLSDLYKLAKKLNKEVIDFLPTVDELEDAIPSIDKIIHNLPSKEKAIAKETRDKYLNQSKKEE